MHDASRQRPRPGRAPPIQNHQRGGDDDGDAQRQPIPPKPQTTASPRDFRQSPAQTPGRAGGPGRDDPSTTGRAASASSARISAAMPVVCSVAVSAMRTAAGWPGNGEACASQTVHAGGPPMPMPAGQGRRQGSLAAFKQTEFLYASSAAKTTPVPDADCHSGRLRSFWWMPRYPR